MVKSEIAAHVKPILFVLFTVFDKIGSSHKSDFSFFHACASCSELPSNISIKLRTVNQNEGFHDMNNITRGKRHEGGGVVKLECVSISNLKTKWYSYTYIYI